MKILLITASEEISMSLCAALSRNGVQNDCVITYTNPMKAIDNIAEIAPEHVMINAAEFPRHWKMAAQFIKSAYDKYLECRVHIIVNEKFSDKERAKALEIGVSMIIEASSVAHLKRSDFLRTSAKNDVQVLMQHPHTQKMITGVVESNLEKLIIFRPDSTELTADLNEGDLILRSTMKTPEGIVPFYAEVTENKQDELYLQIL
ncbi:MAG: hypothetical protein Ta2A_03230 [Treponemataceae bacterium]|nr:MAG: hypothetical protein Ta2A_03230 [Treponemataceae bacterium]